MRRLSFVLVMLALLAATGVSQAQLRVFPGTPFGPSRGRLVITGSFGNGYFAAPILIPASEWGYPYVIVEPRVSVRVITPAAAPRVLAPALDLSGIDLDVAPPPWAGEFERPKHEPRRAPKPRPEEAAKRIEPVPVKEAPARPKPVDLLEPKADPIEEGQRLSMLGLAAFRSREYGLAARKFNQALDLDPAASRAHFFLGQAYFALGKYRDAVQAIGLGLGLDPAWPKNPFRPRFDLYLDHPEDWQRHLVLLEDTQARQPKDVGYMFLLAHQRWFDDQRDDAGKLFGQVRTLVADPTLVDLFLKTKVP